MDLHTAIRTLRETVGESQQVFATKLGVSIRAYASYEKNTTPRLALLFKLDRLMRETPAMPREAREALKGGLDGVIKREIDSGSVLGGVDGGMFLFEMLYSAEEAGWAHLFRRRLYDLRSDDPKCQAEARASFQAFRKAGKR